MEKKKHVILGPQSCAGNPQLLTIFEDHNKNDEMIAIMHGFKKGIRVNGVQHLSNIDTTSTVYFSPGQPVQAYDRTCVLISDEKYFLFSYTHYDNRPLSIHWIELRAPSETNRAYFAAMSFANLGIKN